MHRQKGVALLTVVFVFAILSLVVAASIVLAKTDVSTSKNNERGNEALVIAEAGIDWTVAQFRANPKFSMTAPAVRPVGQGTYTVSIPTLTSTYAVIKSVGYLPLNGSEPAANRAIQIILSLPQSTFDASAYWHRALHSEGKITGSGSGEVFVDGDVPEGPTVQSNYSASGQQSIDFSGSIYINGSPGLGYVPTVPPALPALPPDTGHGLIQAVADDPVPTMDFNYWRAKAKEAGTFAKIKESGSSFNLNGGYVTGNIDISGSGTLNGIYFAEGNIDLSGSYSGNATFISAHTIDMSGSMAVGNGSVALIANGEIDISGSQVITGLVYSSTRVEFSGSPIFYGSIVSQGSIHFSGGGEIHYRGGSDLGGVIPGTGTGSTTSLPGMIDWQEVAP
jgi:hypothetical protein